MDNPPLYKLTSRWLFTAMSIESLNRTSHVSEDPKVVEDSNVVVTPRVNVDVLKQRIIDQKKKDKFKRTIIFSTVCVSLGALTILAN